MRFVDIVPFPVDLYVYKLGVKIDSWILRPSHANTIDTCTICSRQAKPINTHVRPHRKDEWRSTFPIQRHAKSTTAPFARLLVIICLCDIAIPHSMYWKRNIVLTRLRYTRFHEPWRYMTANKKKTYVQPSPCTRTRDLSCVK